MKNKALYWLIGLLAVGLLVAAILAKKGIIGKKSGVKVAIEKAAAHDIIESVNASGKIYPVSEVKVSPDISGEVIELLVEEGQQVQRGQLIARIDQSLYTSNVTRANAAVNQSKAGVANAKAQLLQLNAQLAQARSNYERNLKLYNEKVISAQEFETAQAAFKSLQANLEAAKQTINSSKYNVDGAVAGLSEANQNIKRANIFAPSTGIVSKLNTKQGERVVGTAQMAGTEMLRIADMSKMKVEVEIGENDIQKIALGDTAIIEVDAYTKRKFKGLVTKVAQSNSTGALQAASSDQVSNYTVSIEIEPNSYSDLVSNTQFPFRPGMSASVEILTQHNYDVLSVPINAVTTRDLDSTGESLDETIQEYVFVVDKTNKAILTPVSTNIQDNKYIEITKGLAGGEQIICAPYAQVANKLKDKDVVEIVEKKTLFEKEEE
jgi:HlyD family secretion protein